jgi:hypothetical protein
MLTFNIRDKAFSGNWWVTARLTATACGEKKVLVTTVMAV